MLSWKGKKVLRAKYHFRMFQDTVPEGAQATLTRVIPGINLSPFLSNITHLYSTICHQKLKYNFKLNYLQGSRHVKTNMHKLFLKINGISITLFKLLFHLLE